MNSVETWTVWSALAAGGSKIEASADRSEDLSLAQVLNQNHTVRVLVGCGSVPWGIGVVQNPHAVVLEEDSVVLRIGCIGIEGHSEFSCVY